MGTAGGKKEFGHGEDSSASIPMKTVVRDFVAAKEKHLRHPEMGAKISLERKVEKELENNYNPSKRVKSECEGASSSQHGKSKFEYLLDVVAALFTAYEEEQDRFQEREDARNERNVGYEQGPPDELDGLPREFQEKIQELNGCDVQFVTQKELFKTDLNPQQARLSIPPSKIANRFLTPPEESSLNERRGINRRLSGMPVMVLDPSLREYNMCFKKWEMERSYVYNLTKGWNEIVCHNDLKLGDTLHLWSFRLSSKLCFALVKNQVVNTSVAGS